MQRFNEGVSIGDTRGNWTILAFLKGSFFEAICSCGHIRSTLRRRDIVTAQRKKSRGEKCYCSMCRPQGKTPFPDKKHTPIISKAVRNVLTSKTIFGCSNVGAEH